MMSKHVGANNFYMFIIIVLSLVGLQIIKMHCACIKIIK